MGQFTRNIKRKKGIEERKQQAKEHRNQTDFLDERKKKYTHQQKIEEKNWNSTENTFIYIRYVLRNTWMVQLNIPLQN